jgi:hypothetical protein
LKKEKRRIEKCGGEYTKGLVAFLCISPISKIFHPLSARSTSSERRDRRTARSDLFRNLDNIVEEIDMAEDDLDIIFKALRVVPEFDGNPNVLVRFINICDQIIAKCVRPSAGNDLNNLSVLNGILNKITGSAERTLVNNGIPNTWAGIRESLINNFSDRRDETALYTDLSMMTQGRDTPQVFYEKCQHMLSTIVTYVQLHEQVETTTVAKRELYKNLALQTYLRGLSEPLGSRIRCMKPTSLEQALQFAQAELNVMYLQNKNKTYEIAQKPYFPKQNQNNFPQRFSQAEQHFTNNNSFGPRTNPQQAGPSRTQQMFRALPRSNMSTGFRIPHQQQNHPQPMSGVSHPVARTLAPTRNNWNQYPPRNRAEANVHESQLSDKKYFDYENDDYNNYDYNNDYQPPEQYLPSVDKVDNYHSNEQSQEIDIDNDLQANPNFCQDLARTSPR